MEYAHTVEKKFLGVKNCPLPLSFPAMGIPMILSLAVTQPFLTLGVYIQTVNRPKRPAK